MRTHILGFPSIGTRRELKKAQEAYWRDEISEEALLKAGENLKRENWSAQKEAGLDYVVTGDFSFYDRMLDMIALVGAIPARYAPCAGDSPMRRYFYMARGDVARNIPAMEMTKWFDTNYHYIVPEITADGKWSPGGRPVVEDTRLARDLGFAPLPAIIGPFTFLALGKSHDGSDKWARLPELVGIYEKLLQDLAPLCEYIQVEEPVLNSEMLPEEAKKKFRDVYAALNKASGGKIILTTYFAPLAGNLDLALDSGCAALHIDLVRGKNQLDGILKAIPKGMKLSLGLVNGRNIWKTNYAKAVENIKKAETSLGSDNIMLATSCSLLHSPVDLREEKKLPEHIKSRMAFAVQKCGELADLRAIVEKGETKALDDNTAMLKAAAEHPENRVKAVRDRVAAVTSKDYNRASAYPERHKEQAWLELPILPTTTIGSYPQTHSIRKIRNDFKKGEISEAQYVAGIREEIKSCIRKQEEIGLDVLVHGEAERNDMVEYFGQQLGGFCFTENGWVQSYGSRCVKPPVIYGDVFRKHPMTIEWLTYAQSLTSKPVKGMLTGPVTILCWSFPRDDMEREEVCQQIALAMRDEVLDLEKAGIRIIQIDEAALREGMPLTRAEADKYLQWAVDSFRLTSSGVKDSTQIHSHMCYSEFNAILPAIARMDADVISIESSRSGMELLDAFKEFHYQAQVGPGVYDIHSPLIPSEKEIYERIEKALEFIAPDQLWINPDCGLKTRQWEEAYPSLQHMVKAAKKARTKL